MADGPLRPGILPGRPVTLADIARAAGTSPSTASRALNGRGYVSAGARSRLLAAAEQLGYVPNASARTLKQRTSRVVGVVVSDLRNQFYAALAAGIEETLRAFDYQMVLISDHSETGAEIDGAKTFVAMRAAGVILTPVGHEASELLTRYGVGVVEVDRRLAQSPCDAVLIDNELGAREATTHLLAAGHRRVALLVAETDWTTDAGRLAGYRAAHAAARLPLDEALILRIPFAAADAEERIEALLAAQSPTAVFAANNMLAEQAWHVLHRRGSSIPRDVSLVAFDDVPWMAMTDPGITAVAQPTLEMGRRAAHLLLRRLEEPHREVTYEYLRPTLVIRSSTAAAPGS